METAIEAISDYRSYQGLEQALLKPLSFEEKESQLLGTLHALEIVLDESEELSVALRQAKKLEQVAIGQRKALEMAIRVGMSPKSASEYAAFIRRELNDVRQQWKGAQGS
jgi:hypothetical protein